MEHDAVPTPPESTPPAPAADEGRAEIASELAELRHVVEAQQELISSSIATVVRGQAELRQSFEEHEHEAIRIEDEDEDELPEEEEQEAESAAKEEAKATEAAPEPAKVLAPVAPKVERRVGPFRHARNY